MGKQILIHLFFVNNDLQKKKILNTLKKYKIGTKNLPDAIKWHCSYYWKHIFNSKERKSMILTKNILDKAIAIPTLQEKDIILSKFRKRNQKYIMQIIKDFIFIIPARKNSKGIKNKNLIKINNKKLVEYTFDILKNIPENRKYVLTDSKSIKSIARKYQINTSYKRPKILSKDTTELVMNLIHFDNFIGENVNFKKLYYFATNIKF